MINLKAFLSKMMLRNDHSAPTHGISKVLQNCTETIASQNASFIGLLSRCKPMRPRNQMKYHHVSNVKAIRINRVQFCLQNSLMYEICFTKATNFRYGFYSSSLSHFLLLLIQYYFHQFPTK